MGASTLRLLATFCLLLHPCYSDLVFSKNGHLLEEETFNDVFNTEVEEQNETKQPNLLFFGEGSGSSSSASLDEDGSSSKKSRTTSHEPSSESSSSEEIQGGKIDIKRSTRKESDSSSSEESKQNQGNSSESDESSSSQDVKKVRLVKRALDSSHESLNTIRKNTNGTNNKENHLMDKKETTVVETTVETTEPTTTDEEVSTASTDSLRESTIVEEQSTETTKVTDSTETAATETAATETAATATAATETAEAAEVTEETQYTSGETEPQVTSMEPERTTAATETTEKETEATEQKETTAEEEQSPTTSTTSTTELPTSEGSDSDTEEEEDSPMASNSTLPEVETSKSPPSSEEKPPYTFVQVAMARVNKLSDQIRIVLYNYRITNAVVIPGQTFFPDPMPMQDFEKSFSVGTMTFKNMLCHGLSNFTIEHVNTDVDRMQVYVLLHMKRLVILGNYTLRTFWTRAAGPFNVTLLDVDSEGVAEVATAPEGHLEATDSQMDMSTKEMKVDFRNMGLTGSLVQGAVGAIGDALFNSIKPQILDRVNVIIRTDVNKKLKEFSTKFINKVSPVDLAFSEGRKYVKTHGYDPFRIKDHSFLIGGLVHVNITEFWVEGLSKFYRVGNLSLSMDNGSIEIGVHVLTQQLTGSCVWSGQTFGILKSGKTNFTVDHLQARAFVTQSLDVRKKPQLRDLDLELGWVKVTMDSPMTLNLMIEGIINAFPRLIRHIIVDTVEEPLRERIQEILNKINVESIVDEHLPRLDSFGL